MDIDTKYDSILAEELKKRLKRDALPSELVNGDNDSDLVTECLWQIIAEYDHRIDTLEKTVSDLVKLPK